MSKNKVQRTPVPDDHIERFYAIVLSMVEPFGVDREPAIYRHIEALGHSVERYLFEKKHKMSPKKRINLDRRQFIAIFKQRYLAMTDFEYGRPVTGVDGRLIGQTCTALREIAIEVSDYLKWLFEEFLADNEKFCPPTMGFSCSALVWEKFLFSNKERLVRQREEERMKQHALDVIARARYVMRQSESDEVKKKVKESLKSYGAGGIMLSELEKVVRRFESAQEQE